ncbi:F0F1 ATP synthase subunit gamma [Nostocoides australiense]|nr:F0F1 ATP synthase subunit gamma [Actinomycetota bacterium]HPF82085.1 F0F1 ATP synthase subunit gamma [Tetrasphaera australiensis]HRW02356.1 F0F1 ATP synthase subunit gamma [Tetrasphaera sp.]
MGAQIRVYRQRIRSVSATKKITRAMELMAASRVVKARTAVLESAPYTHALTTALSALATHSNYDHPMTTEVENPTRAGVLILTSDRGLAGAYASGTMKESERLIGELRADGKEVVPYLVGRKAVSYYKFRGRDYAAEWTGNTEKPQVERAREISERLIEDFLRPTEEGGLDEIHVVYTRFNTMVNQEARVLRLLPIEVVDAPEDANHDGVKDILPLYQFEPNAEEVLHTMLPRYVTARIWTCLLSAATSELAARQRAMKSATDNAENLINTYTRLANQARQAEITQEISEIVGGASALAESK